MSGMNPKKVLVAAKGFQGRGKNCITIARRRVTKAMQHNYIGRKNRRREFRKQWIQRVNAGVREYNIPYSRFIDGMKKSDIALNRKMLAEMAVYEPYSFGAVVEQTKELAQIPERYYEQHGYVMSNVVINRNPSYIPDPIRNPALINDNDSTEYAHLHAKPTMIEEVIETETQEIQQ